MADFENTDDRDNLTTEELRGRVRDALEDHAGLDADDINVHVENGVVRLIGRVGTESEQRVAEHIVTDVLGIMSVSNELVVDSMRRAESPMDMEEHLEDEDAHSDLLLGDRALPFQPEAEHLAENLEGQLYGTTDVGASIADGVPYIPPESPTPEGLGGTDATPGSYGEDH